MSGSSCGTGCVDFYKIRKIIFHSSDPGVVNLVIVFSDKFKKLTGSMCMLKFPLRVEIEKIGLVR